MARSKRKPVPADCGQEKCENYKFRTVEPNDTICRLCEHEYCRLRKAVCYANSDRREAARKSLARRLMKQAERESPNALYWVLRALYGLIIENNNLDAIDAYEMLSSFVPQTTGHVFDYNQKEQTGGSVCPSLSGRIHSLLEEEAAKQEKIKAKLSEEAAKQAPVKAPSSPSIVDDGGMDSVPF
ncbi:MAG: hypothetical protein ACK5JO_03890 [Halodesulfovibrio sp.]